MVNFIKLFLGAGDMAPWLRALAALVEDPDSVPRTHMQLPPACISGSKASVGICTLRVPHPAIMHTWSKEEEDIFIKIYSFFFCSLQVKNNILISNTVERKGYLNPSDSACFCFIILQLVVVSMRMPPTGSCIWTPGPQWMALMEGYRTFRSWRLVEELHHWGWGEPGGFTAWILFLLSLSDPCVWLRCDQSAFSCSHVFPDCCPAFLTWWTISPQEL